MKKNSQTNNLIRDLVILADFVVLNAIQLVLVRVNPLMADWTATRIRSFIIFANIALMMSEYFSSPIIHKRQVSVGDIFQRVFWLTGGMVILGYLLMKMVNLKFPVGYSLGILGAVFFVINMIARYIERKVIKMFRQSGRNTRMVTFVGADSELLNIYSKLNDDTSKGYKILGYYADDEMSNIPDGIELERLGTLEEFMDAIQSSDSLDTTDEIYVSISRKRRDVIRKISNYCDQKMIRFYYVPVSVETLGINLKRELLDDIEIFTTYENPLLNPINKLVKRVFDVVLSGIFLLLTLLFWPIIWLVIKIQSPGPLFFTQTRTGLDGKDFKMYKFRSMHVNDDADKLQATEDDPRKYPFGNFMRKANIDEFPQFWNVLKGDMSIVGPRPHMLAHTEQYSALIDKYMVRHFVKPGVTGWAQVTGYRGETKELWQMEERVKRDIWYMEHWSIWLDIRIIWMTAKTVFVHDKNAY